MAQTPRMLLFWLGLFLSLVDGVTRMHLASIREAYSPGMKQNQNLVALSHPLCVALRGGGAPLDHFTRAHYFDDEGQEEAPPAEARAPKPAKGSLPEKDEMLERMEAAAIANIEKYSKKMQHDKKKPPRNEEPESEEEYEGAKPEDFALLEGEEDLFIHDDPAEINEGVAYRPQHGDDSTKSDDADSGEAEDIKQIEEQASREEEENGDDAEADKYKDEGSDEDDEDSEDDQMEATLKGVRDPLADDENYQRIKSIPDPEDFSSDDEGYNLNPFKGVRVPHWFMAENIDPPSTDPAIKALNERLWDACDDGDADEALKAIELGAQVNAADPHMEFDWTALMHACAPHPAAGLPSLYCNETADAVERKRMRVVDCLMEHGARIDVTDIYGETPLHYAAVRGYPKLTRKLIELGVDIHRENMYGCSAQRIAEINQRKNPGCWEAAEVIAAAGGYDAGWPDRGPVPKKSKKPGPRERAWMRTQVDPEEEEAKEAESRKRALRRIERDAMLLERRNLGKLEDQEDEGGEADDE